MGNIELVRLYRNSVNRQEWDEFVSKADGATIFHNYTFLGYHGNKFNEHHLGVYKDGMLIGFMPMAITENNGILIAKSPYGGSYGGFIFINPISYTISAKIVNALIEYMDSIDVRHISITPPIDEYYLIYSDTFTFAMLERGFIRSNADVTSIVHLNDMTKKRKELKRKADKAKKMGVIVIMDAPIDDFWAVVENTFARHNATPTHTIGEFAHIAKALPDSVYWRVAYINKQPIAAIGCFVINNLAKMSFYICSDFQYKETQAISLLFYEEFEVSARLGFYIYDLGTSSAHMSARENIFTFKESLGAVGRFRQTFDYEF